MIDEAIDALGQIPQDERSIGALSTFVDNTDPEGNGARLDAGSTAARSGGCSTGTRTRSSLRHGRSGST